MQCNVTPVTFLGIEFHENVGKFSELAHITAESGVLRSFEWYTVLCMGGECDRSYFTVQLFGEKRLEDGKQRDRTGDHPRAGSSFGCLFTAKA